MFGNKNLPHSSDMENAKDKLYNDICGIIDGTRDRVATYMNTRVCMINWYIGRRIKEEILLNRRADYGMQTIQHLSERLTLKYGNIWGLPS